MPLRKTTNFFYSFCLKVIAGRLSNFLRSVFVIYECPLRLYFFENFKESSKNLKTIDLILTSNVEVFWGQILKNLKSFMQSSTSKNLKISEMSILNLEKPQTLRMSLRIDISKILRILRLVIAKKIWGFW